MSRTSSYHKEKCFNLNCSSFADRDNELCWLDGDDDPKGFCSIKCKEEFSKNNKDYKKLKQLKQQIYSKNNRRRENEKIKQEELADVICLWAKPAVSKNEIIEMIIFLGLESKNL